MRLQLLTLLAAAQAVAAESWSFSSAKLDISSKQHTIDPSAPVPLHAQFLPSDKLKLTLTCKLDDLARKPHQAMLLVRNPDTGLEASIVIPVKSNGRGSLAFAYTDLSSHLLTSEELELTLIIAGFGNVTPVLTKIAVLEVGSDGTNAYTPPTTPLRYGAMPEITHTFKKGETMPPVVVSVAFSLVLATGILGLLAAWNMIGVNTNAISTAVQKSPLGYTVFFASLVGIEGLFAVYWLRLRIMAAIAGLTVLSVPLFFSGRFVLREVESRQKAGLR